MVTRPCSLRISWSRRCSLAESAVGLAALGEPVCAGGAASWPCCAPAGNTVTASENTINPSTRRRFITLSSGRDALAIGCLPAPGSGPISTLTNAFLVDLRDDLAVPREQRFRRAHLGAERQLALGQPVAAVFRVLGWAVVRLRTAGAVGALVHLS